MAFESLLFISFLIGGSLSCSLVPDKSSSSCLELKSQPYITSEKSSFGNYIEGASVNPAGHVFAVNYGLPGEQNTLGRIFPSQHRLYKDALTNSLLNGIRFYNKSIAYVVDAVNHRVLKLHIAETGEQATVESSSVFCSSDEFLQPNDLTLSIKTGTVFTSGMKWLADTNNTHGDIWACLQNGKKIKLEVMGRTNGIDLSPDETILYVSESYNRESNPIIQKIWKYSVNPYQGTISGKTLFADFAKVDGSVHVDIDGMKTDMKGNLFVTRHGGSHVVVFSPDGKVIGNITLHISNPTNLEFGGEKGTTLFIVGKCRDNEQKGCVDKLEVTNPGRSWKLLQSDDTDGVNGQHKNCFVALILVSAFALII